MVEFFLVIHLIFSEYQNDSRGNSRAEDCLVAVVEITLKLNPLVLGHRGFTGDLSKLPLEERKVGAVGGDDIAIKGIGVGIHRSSISFSPSSSPRRGV